MTTWMVVEDEPDLYEMVLAMYEFWGFEGLAFVNGEDAIAWIDHVDQGRVQGDLPQLVLLDIRLPGQINGVEVGARLRQSPYLQSMAIVLMTAFKLSPKEEKEYKKISGADLLLYKPLPTLKELQATLEKIVAKRS
ncbi:MAG: response regulator [Anaerolineae bacterium]